MELLDCVFVLLGIHRRVVLCRHNYQGMLRDCIRELLNCAHDRMSSKVKVGVQGQEKVAKTENLVNWALIGHVQVWSDSMTCQ